MPNDNRMTPEEAKKMTTEEFLATTRKTVGMDTDAFFRQTPRGGAAPIPPDQRKAGAKETTVTQLTVPGLTG